MKNAPFAILILLVALFTGCGPKPREVVVYTSQDQIYAEPILADFTRQTSIKVLPVFDSESVKTAGLAQRLIAEQGHPRADVFWSNEEMISRHLAEINVLDTNFWAKAGYRTRRLIINTNHISLADAPKSLTELTSAKWFGKVAMAYPLYGTTAAHFVSLRQSWGDARWREWCKALAANKPFIVDGNSVVVRLVGNGEAWIGLTDSDDFAAGLRNKFPIASLPLAEDLLAIANSVGIVRSAPHPTEADAFYRFAQAKETLQKLIDQNAIEGLATPASVLQLKQPAPVDETRDLLKTIFARQ